MDESKSEELESQYGCESPFPLTPVLFFPLPTHIIFPSLFILLFSISHVSSSHLPPPLCVGPIYPLFPFSQLFFFFSFAHVFTLPSTVFTHVSLLFNPHLLLIVVFSSFISFSLLFSRLLFMVVLLSLIPFSLPSFSSLSCPLLIFCLLLPTSFHSSPLQNSLPSLFILLHLFYHSSFTSQLCLIHLTLYFTIYSKRFSSISNL